MKEEIAATLKEELKLDDKSIDKLITIIYLVEEAPISKEIVKINPVTGKAQTVKLKNLTVNLKRLSIDAFELGVGIAGAIATPWLIPFAGLLGINKLSSGVKINLTPEHAIVLQGMWEEYSRNGNILSRQQAYTMVTKKIIELEKSKITQAHFELLVKELEALKILKTRVDEIWLIETIKFDSTF